MYGVFWSGRPARSALGLDELPPTPPCVLSFFFSYVYFVTNCFFCEIMVQIDFLPCMLGEEVILLTSDRIINMFP